MTRHQPTNNQFDNTLDDQLDNNFDNSLLDLDFNSDQFPTLAQNSAEDDLPSNWQAFDMGADQWVAY